MGGAGLWVATETGGPKRRLLGVVYFYFKSNSPSLINEFVEGSDSVPGDGERKKKERYQVYLELCQRRERRVSAQVGSEGGIPVCSVRGRGAD